MSQVTMDVSKSSLKAFNLTDVDAGPELRVAAAMKLFELGRLSSGAAAELAEISKTEFLARLGDYQVPAFSLTEDELKSDLANA